MQLLAQEDLAIAEAVIKKHIDLLPDGESLPMPKLLIGVECALEYTSPAWMLELSEVFGDRYGLFKGEHITRCVLLHYLLKGKTIH